MLNTSKVLSDIETDIRRYYTLETPNAIDVALKIAGRALSLAAHLHGGEQICTARTIVFEAILERVK